VGSEPPARWLPATIAHSQRIPAVPRSPGIGDPDDRVVWGDREQLVVGGVGAEAHLLRAGLMMWFSSMLMTAAWG
jgi:hypothetical protein